jgi:hypothetical protein
MLGGPSAVLDLQGLFEERLSLALQEWLWRVHCGLLGLPARWWTEATRAAKCGSE